MHNLHWLEIVAKKGYLVILVVIFGGCARRRERVPISVARLLVIRLLLLHVARRRSTILRGRRAGARIGGGAGGLGVGGAGLVGVVLGGRARGRLRTRRLGHVTGEQAHEYEEEDCGDHSGTRH